MQVKSGVGTQVAEAYVTLRATQGKLAADIWGINALLKNRLAQSGLAAGRAFGDKFAAGYRSAIERLNGIVTGTLLGGAAAGAGFVGWGVKLAAEQEQMAAAYEVMLGSREKAMKLLGEIKQFAMTTPYEQKELNSATKMLLALSVPLEEILPTLRRLGDIASALNIPITELAELFGKMRTQGKLLSNDIYQLGGRGIPIVAELAKQFGVAESEVMDLVSSGKVGFSSLEKAIRSMTDAGGLFAGNMDVQSKTLNGVLSGVRDQIAEVAITLGTSLMPAIKEITGNLSESMPEVQSAAESIGDAMEAAFSTDNIQSFSAALMDSVDALKLLGAHFDEAQLGAARLARIAAVLNPAIQAWRVAGHEDEYQGMLSAFDAGIKSLAEQATTRDPETGKIQNNTDLRWQEFGKRSQELRQQRAAANRPQPQWLQNQLKNIQNFKQEDTPFVKRLFEMQDSFKSMGKSMLAGIGKNVLGRTGEALAAGAGRTARAMTPEDKYLRGGFTSFEGLNRQIQETLLQDNSSKQTAQNTKQQVDLSKKANEVLKQIKDAAKKWGVWVP